VAAAFFALPSEVKKFVQRAQRGELEVRFRGIEEHARLVYALGHQIIYAGLGITAGAFGMVFDGRNETRQAHWAFWAAGGFALMLSWSIVTTRSRMRKRRK